MYVLTVAAEHEFGVGFLGYMGEAFSLGLVYSSGCGRQSFVHGKVVYRDLLSGYSLAVVDFLWR